MNINKLVKMPKIMINMQFTKYPIIILSQMRDIGLTMKT